MAKLQGPTPEAAREAVQRFRSHTSTQRWELLRHIVDTYLTGTAAGLPKERIAMTLSQEQIAEAVFHIGKEQFHQRGKRPPTNVRAVIDALRADLATYYETTPEEEVLLQIPGANSRRGHVVGYIPTISWRSPLGDLSESAKHQFRTAIKERDSRTKESFARAIILLREILTENEGHATTKARLAEMYALRVMHGITLPDADLIVAKQIATEALTAAPELWDAHIAMAAVHLCFYDWTGAAAAFSKARRISERKTHVQPWYFFFMATHGRLQDMIQYLNEAASDENVSTVIRRNLGLALILNGDHEAAENELKRLVQDKDTTPHFLFHIYLAMAYHENGKYEAALEQMRLARELPNSEYMTPGMWVLTLAKCNRPEAERELKQLLKRKLEGEPYVACSHLAIAYIGLGNNEEAITWLEQACDSHDPLALLLRNWPMMRVLHGHSRFQAILQRMKYPGHAS